MKTAIIALDALEYTLVEELNLKKIKQKEYGKVSLPQTKILTPIMWATFITGTTKHGITSFTVRRNPIIKLGGNLLQKIGISEYSGPRHFMRKILIKFGLFTSPVDKRDVKIKTIFDHAKNPIAISVPAYNEWESIHIMRLKYPFTKLIEKNYGKEIDKCVETNWKIFHQKIDCTTKVLEKPGVDLLMVHFLILDTLGHLYWNKPWKIKDAYRFMNMTIGKLISEIKEHWVLIISDHGMKKGMHTNYAFYSSNIPLNLENPKLTDFYNVIIQKLKEN